MAQIQEQMTRGGPEMEARLEEELPPGWWRPWPGSKAGSLQLICLT